MMSSMPPNFEDELKKAILQINSIDKNWGILGVFGAIMESGKRKFYGYVRDRGNNLGSPNNLPHEVQTLDELLLITKGDFYFDEQFDLHFYGADICLQAIKQGRKNYAISAYCHHNSSRKMGGKDQSFTENEARFKEKWKNYLPILTLSFKIKKKRYNWGTKKLMATILLTGLQEIRRGSEAFTGCLS